MRARPQGFRQSSLSLERSPEMSTGAISSPERLGDLARESLPWRDARFQAYVLLRVGFAVAPILFGLDKFFDVMVDWPKYLAPWLNDLAPGSASDFMHI